MPQTQRDVKNRIGSVKNIQKITRAMEMVAAARLRRAEHRITALRPYAEALRRMTRQAAQAAGAEAGSLALLNERKTISSVGLLLIAGDRGLAGAFNSQVVRAGVRAGAELGERGQRASWYAVGRRGISSLGFRGLDVSAGYSGFIDRPAYADARRISEDLVTAYADGHVDRVEMIYNRYVSPLSQPVTREVLLPLSKATLTGEEEHEGQAEERPAGLGATGGGRDQRDEPPRSFVEYEPDPKEILRRLIPDYVEISIFRALLETTVGFFGAQMTAMRNASQNAGELITDLTLEMNRARQAEITQEILEVVAGAEGVS